MNYDYPKSSNEARRAGCGKAQTHQMSTKWANGAFYPNLRQRAKKKKKKAERERKTVRQGNKDNDKHINYLCQGIATHAHTHILTHTHARTGTGRSDKVTHRWNWKISCVAFFRPVRKIRMKQMAREEARLESHAGGKKVRSD